MSPLRKFCQMYFSYIVLINATYSSNIALIILGYIDVLVFTEIALYISIFSLICSIAGGSVRHTKKILNISLNDINKLINLRIIASIFLLIILVIIGYSHIVYSFVLRKLSEWIIDPHISDRKSNYYDILFVFIDAFSMLIGFVIFIFTSSSYSFYFWGLMPLLFLFDNQSFELNFSRMFKENNLSVVFGYDGFASISTLIFRYCVYLIDTSFASNVLYYTMIFGFSAGFFVKIITPISNLIYNKKLIKMLNMSKKYFDIVFIAICLLIFYDKINIITLMSAATFFIVTGLYYRQIYFYNNSNSQSKIFMYEVYINSSVLLIFIPLVYFDTTNVIYYFFINSIINYYLYRWTR